MPVKKEIIRSSPVLTKSGVDKAILEYREKYNFLGKLKVTLPIHRESELINFASYYPPEKAFFDIDFLKVDEIKVEEFK